MHTIWATTSLNYSVRFIVQPRPFVFDPKAFCVIVKKVFFSLSGFFSWDVEL